MAPHEKSDRRSRRSRRLIVDALVGLMGEKRYDRITVQDIVDRADVGRTTFYAQFRNKDDVLLGEFGRVLGLLHEERTVATAACDGGPLPSLSLFRHVHEQRSLFVALARGQAFDEHCAGVRRHLRAASMVRLAPGPAPGDPAVPPELVADFLAGALLGLVRWWLDQGLPQTPEEMDAIYRRLVTPGVRAAAGRGKDA
jgi:AcrR family transcriptional regulator